MDEKLVRKSLGALDGLEHQRRDAMEILVRHLTNDTPNCEETINRLLAVLDNKEAVAEVNCADDAREELSEALEPKRETPAFVNLPTLARGRDPEYGLGDYAR